MTHFIHHTSEAMADIDMNTVSTFPNTWDIGNWSIYIILIPCVNTAEGSWYFWDSSIYLGKKLKGKVNPKFLANGDILCSTSVSAIVLENIIKYTPYSNHSCQNDMYKAPQEALKEGIIMYDLQWHSVISKHYFKLIRFIYFILIIVFTPPSTFIILMLFTNAVLTTV